MLKSEFVEYAPVDAMKKIYIPVLETSNEIGSRFGGSVRVSIASSGLSRQLGLDTK